MKIKLGARILKTGLAVVLSIYIGELLGFDRVVYAAIAAVLTVQPSLYRSWKYMLEQIQANIIGATLAIGAIFAFGSEPWVVGIVVMLAISINLKLGFEKSITMVVLIVIAIMEVSDENTILFAVNRFSLVMIGILSSMLINVIFMPPKYAGTLMKEIRKTNDKMSSFLRFVTDHEADMEAMKEEREEIKKSLEKIDNLYSLYQEEFKNKLWKLKYADAKKMVIIKHFINTTIKNYTIMEAFEAHYRSKISISDELKEEINQHLKLVIEYKEKIHLKHEGKIKIQHQHRKDTDIEDSGDRLVKRIITSTTVENGEKGWVHSLPIISSIVELTQELDRLEKLIESQRLHKRDEK